MLIKIDIQKPAGADISDIAQFVYDALSSWGGGLHPEDPMFHSLKITRMIVHGRPFAVPIDDEPENIRS